MPCTLRSQHLFFALVVVALGLLLGLPGCDEESTEPEDDSLQLPELTNPENVMLAYQSLYNDREHSASERLAGYASLFDTAFVFYFQPSDIANGLPKSWGLDEELVTHQHIFEAQDHGDIYSLVLRFTHDDAQPLTPPEVGREDWTEVFATNIYLRLMFNLEDGIEVNGAQGRFKFPPPENAHYKIGDWTDMPRPGLLGRSAVDPATWGRIKATYN